LERNLSTLSGRAQSLGFTVQPEDLPLLEELAQLDAISRGLRRSADFGQLAWLAVFDEDDRSEFFEELRDALALAESTWDATPVERCLRDWRTTAQALSDPLRRALLTGPGDDDYAEVDRPEG
jgi:hypothetical protein